MAGRPRLGALAVRNITHRPGEALTVVLGAMLGTAVIVAAFVVGDSFSGSIRDVARTELGPIDEQIQIRVADQPADGGVPVDPVRQIAEIDNVIRHAPPPGTDGLISSTAASVVLSNGRSDDERKVLPTACALRGRLCRRTTFRRRPRRHRTRRRRAQPLRRPGRAQRHRRPTTWRVHR